MFLWILLEANGNLCQNVIRFLSSKFDPVPKLPKQRVVSKDPFPKHSWRVMTRWPDTICMSTFRCHVRQPTTAAVGLFDCRMNNYTRNNRTLGIHTCRVFLFTHLVHNDITTYGQRRFYNEQMRSSILLQLYCIVYVWLCMWRNVTEASHGRHAITGNRTVCSTNI